MKNFFDEFKKFISRGSVMDLAVGVIIGGAFQAIINSLVNDIIMPLITLITGGIDFTNWFVSLDGTKYATLAAAQEAGASTLNYGVFITAVINFLLMAIVIFSIVKAMNKIAEKTKKKEEEKKPEPTAEEKLLTEIRDLLKK
ncbi:MAG: large conductance mechanosensitive channel protein MscL [Lachnospiraceae bacterium]|nr:large conductance mechanosensitive channel protein MscL [Lachnospiraceae bacterium]